MSWSINIVDDSGLTGTGYDSEIEEMVWGIRMLVVVQLWGDPGVGDGDGTG